MAVDSINRLPSLHVPQSNDTGAEKEKKRQESKNKKKDASSSEAFSVSTSEESEPSLPSDGSQILGSEKTVQLLQSKPFEPETTKKHALLKMTQRKNVKNPTVKKPNKLNKSA